MRMHVTGRRTAIDVEQTQVLELLHDAGVRPLPLRALVDAGVRHPATVVYELELRGYLIRHVAIPGAADTHSVGFRLDGVAEGAAEDILASGLPGTLAPAGER